MGENKIESFKQYGDASGISSHYLFKRLKLHSVRNMLCTCIVWCDETAMMIEYCAKMIGAIGVETREEKRMKISTNISSRFVIIILSADVYFTDMIHTT